MNEQLLMENVSAHCQGLDRGIYEMDIFDRTSQATLIF